jgi:hypothetical protein
MGETNSPSGLVQLVIKVRSLRYLYLDMKYDSLCLVIDISMN